MRFVDQDVRLPFSDRHEAGRLLGQALARFKAERPVVLALPRGGVPVAYDVAVALDADLDVLLVRKLGAPGNEEFGIGALVDGDPPGIILNEEIVSFLALPASYIEAEAERQLAELERRRWAYLAGRSPVSVRGRTVILVDDGIATGGTVRAALRGIRKRFPRKLILAVPVAPAPSLEKLGAECDEIVCLATPDPFYAVGAYYADFTQTTDAEVKDLLDARRHAGTVAAG